MANDMIPYNYISTGKNVNQTNHSNQSAKMTLNLTGPRTTEPRSTAYYYADIERLKRKQNGTPHITDEAEEPRNPDELSEYVESNEVVNEGPKVEVPPLRDRQYSLPEYTTPEACRVPEETYSTAGTFPMPEPKEKEPLLAELELVGRLPLNQLESGSGVRRSRSWYFCCPNVADEEASRESSWRYSSLRPVTAPPMGRNGMSFMVTTQSSGHHDAASLRCERDALARALSAERARAAAAARAHDARLAELHGVIAELVRRRAADKQARAIPEEEVSDECESTTQPAGELDNDADRSRTDQNDSSSIVSPAELPTPQEPKAEVDSDTFKHEVQVRIEKPQEMSSSETHPADNCDTSLDLSARDSEICLSTARCCGYVPHPHSADSCEREHGSASGARVCPASPLAESRQAKLASRVRLRRTDDGSKDETWCADAAERLALDVCAQADLREALVAASNDGCALTASVAAWRARCARLEADCRVLQCALTRAADTAHRLSCACAIQESSSVSVCLALRAADRALETYDVLLALAETLHSPPEERKAAELVARQLLARLESEQSAVSIGEPLLSPGPWLQHDSQVETESEWTEECETRLRSHAARLKSDTVSLRSAGQAPALFSYHDIEEEDLPKSVGSASMAEMEAAVMMQEILAAREARAAARAADVAAGRHSARDEHHKRDEHHMRDEHHTRDEHRTREERHARDEHHTRDEHHARDEHRTREERHARDDLHKRDDQHKRDEHHTRDEHRTREERHTRDEHHARDDLHKRDDQHKRDEHHTRDEHRTREERHTRDEHHARDDLHKRDDQHKRDEHHTRDEHRTREERHTRDEHHARDDLHKRDDHTDYKDHRDKELAPHKSDSTRSRRRRERHWLETQASETDL